MSTGEHILGPDLLGQEPTIENTIRAIREHMRKTPLRGGADYFAIHRADLNAILDEAEGTIEATDLMMASAAAEGHSHRCYEQAARVANAWADESHYKPSPQRCPKCRKLAPCVHWVDIRDFAAKFPNLWFKMVHDWKQQQRYECICGEAW